MAFGDSETGIGKNALWTDESEWGVASHAKLELRASIPVERS